MKFSKLLFILTVISIAFVSCFPKKQLVKLQLDSNNRPLPVEASEVLAQIVEVLPQQQAIMKSSPCAKAPCEATVKVMQVLKSGQAFLPTLSRNEDVRIRFAYTLAPTDSIFPDSDAHLPGLNKGDVFKAHVRIIGQAESGLNLYEISNYEKQ